MTGWGKSVWVLIYRGAASARVPRSRALPARPVRSVLPAHEPVPLNGEEPRQNYRKPLAVSGWSSCFGVALTAVRPLSPEEAPCVPAEEVHVWRHLLIPL